MSNENQTKVCKHCQSEIPKKAKVCPQCRKKQGGIMKWILIVGIVLILISAMAGGGDDEKETVSSGGADVTAENQQNNAEEAEQVIEYTACTVAEMMDLLESNAMKAEDTYQDQYVEVTGRLANIDSDGKYISLYAADDEWAFTGVQCYLENDEQKAQVMEMSIGDIITLRGQITDVGEVLGYSLEIDSID